MGRRGVRDPESKERIVEAARRCIAELGVQGATVRAIATRAGVSTGYVMHYFPDKRRLASAVLAANNVKAGARVDAARRERRGLDALTAAVEAVLPLDGERRVEWQVWVAFWTSADDGDAGDMGVRGLRDARAAFRRMLAAPFAEAIADGELPDTLDVHYECERLLTLAAGLGLTAGADPAVTVRRLARRMLADHLASLAGPARRSTAS
jgi:AcrR family transcriptional regulator